MIEKQNGRSETDELSPGRDEEEAAREKSETPRSYYYDDATGYEIYDEETEVGEKTDESDDEAR